MPEVYGISRAGQIRTDSLGRGNGCALEERGEVLQPKLGGDIANASAAQFGLERDCCTQRCQQAAGLSVPADEPEALTGPAQGKVRSDHSKREVVSKQVGARDEHQQARCNKTERIDDQPESVLVEVATKLQPEETHRCAGVEIIRVEEVIFRLLA